MSFSRLFVRVCAAAVLVAGAFGIATSQPVSSAVNRYILIATGPGPGGGPHVKVYRYGLAINQPQEIGSFFAFPQEFKGGVEVAIGDLNGDGFAEVVTGAGPGGAPHVRAFSPNGVPVPNWSFYAYGDFPGGVHVGVTDWDGDGNDEIVTGAGAGGGPHVKVWDLVSGVPTVVAQWFAYQPTFNGGVFVSRALVNGETRDEGVATGAGPGGGPHVRVFDAPDHDIASFFAFAPDVTGGVSVAGQTHAGGVEGAYKGLVVSRLDGRGDTRWLTYAGTLDQHQGAEYKLWPRGDSGGQIAYVGPSTDSIVAAAYRPGGTQCGDAGCTYFASFVKMFGSSNAAAWQLNPYGHLWNGGLRAGTWIGNYDDGVPTTTTSTSTTSTSTSTTSTSTTSTSTTSTTTSTTIPIG